MNIFKKILVLNLIMSLIISTSLWANDEMPQAMRSNINMALEKFVKNYNSSRSSVKELTAVFGGHKELENYVNQSTIKDFPEIEYKDGKIIIPSNGEKFIFGIVSLGPKEIVISINDKIHKINTTDSNVDKMKALEINYDNKVTSSFLNLLISEAHAGIVPGFVKTITLYAAIIVFVFFGQALKAVLAAGLVIIGAGAIYDSYQLRKIAKECNLNLSNSDIDEILNETTKTNTAPEADFNIECKKPKPAYNPEFCLEYFKMTKCLEDKVKKLNPAAVNASSKEKTREAPAENKKQPTPNLSR